VGSLEGTGVGNSVGFLDGTRAGSPVGSLDGARVGGFEVGTGVLRFGRSDLEGDCVGWETTLFVELLPMFRSGSTIAAKDALEMILRSWLIVCSSTEFSSINRTPLKSPGRKNSGSRKGKSTVLTRPIRIGSRSRANRSFVTIS